MAATEVDSTTTSTSTLETLTPNSIYVCSKCSKPFVTEPSRDRHVRYCGSRTRNRPRSCQLCNAAKTKCSFDIPCLRCTKKGTQCVYDTIVRKEKRTGTNSSKNVCRNEETVGSKQDFNLINPIIKGVNLGSKFPIFEPNTQYMDVFDQAALSNDTFEDDQNISLFTHDKTISFENLLAFDDFDTDPYQLPIPFSKCLYDSTDQKAGAWCTWMRRGVSLSAATNAYAIQSNTGILIDLPLPRPHAQHNAHLIMQSLRCLPTMMLRRETFPWFIHPQSQLLLRTTSNTLPEALLTCMSISQMFAARTVETKNHLWQNIASEYRRLSREMYHMSEPELLAAIQACMIYLIMCIIDYAPEDEDNAVELLQALYDLYVLAKGTDSEAHFRSETSNPSPNWQAWMLAESRRRLASLWFLIGCVMCVKTGTVCDTTHSYRILPLPAPKVVWEASTETVWNAAYDASIVHQYGGLITIGDLIDAQQAYHIPTNSRKLERWNAGIDNLGSLLNLVEAMV